MQNAQCTMGLLPVATPRCHVPPVAPSRRPTAIRARRPPPAADVVRLVHCALCIVHFPRRYNPVHAFLFGVCPRARARCGCCVGLAVRRWADEASRRGDALNGTASATWERLLKLRTTGSLLHTTAHPDDEHGAMLAWVSRHEGARTGLLTLNRGEAGDNALGPELFDGLGLIRTAELTLAGEYYGVDERYFTGGRPTTAFPSGSTKRSSTGTARTCCATWCAPFADRVRSWSCPAGRVTSGTGTGSTRLPACSRPDAVRLAGDPAAYPELIGEGLRPWAVRKLYIGGVRESEPWQVRVDTAVHDPVLGGSYSVLGRLGLSMQRSQSSGRFDPYAEGQPLFYRRVLPGTGTGHEAGFFDGIDVTWPGVYRLVGAPAPAGHIARLEAIAREVDAAMAAFTITDPAASVPPLARGLAAVRQLAEQTADLDVRFLLDSKADQFEAALVSASGLSLAAVAEAPGRGDAPANPFAPPPTLGPVTAGDTVGVRVVATNRGSGQIAVLQMAVTHPGGTLMTDIPGTDRRRQPIRAPLTHVHTHDSRRRAAHAPLFHACVVGGGAIHAGSSSTGARPSAVGRWRCVVGRTSSGAARVHGLSPRADWRSADDGACARRSPRGEPAVRVRPLPAGDPADRERDARAAIQDPHAWHRGRGGN